MRVNFIPEDGKHFIGGVSEKRGIFRAKKLTNISSPIYIFVAAAASTDAEIFYAILC